MLRSAQLARAHAIHVKADTVKTRNWRRPDQDRYDAFNSDFMSYKVQWKLRRLFNNVATPAVCWDRKRICAPSATRRRTPDFLFRNQSCDTGSLGGRRHRPRRRRILIARAAWPRNNSRPAGQNRLHRRFITEGNGVMQYIVVGGGGGGGLH